MRARANPALIGGFVVGAVALAIVAILLLGGGRFFTDRVELVAFFPGSVNGLAVGAPVKFKGVQIGQVRQIRLAIDEAYRTDFQIPVFFELDAAKMNMQGAAVTPESLRDKKLLKDLYDTGLRAQLEAESFVTGVLFVDLDMHPGTEYQLHLDEDSDLLEIPTLPTTLEQATSAAKQLLAKLEEIDLAELITSLNMTIIQVNELISSPDLKDVAKNLNLVLSDADRAVASVRTLADSTRGNVDALTRSLARTLDGSKDTLAKLDSTLQEASHALDSVAGLVEPESPVIYQVGETLRSLNEAGRSVRRLADSLERNPSTLVFGRPEDGAE